jgi:hypothetical protein
MNTHNLNGPKGGRKGGFIYEEETGKVIILYLFLALKSTKK